MINFTAHIVLLHIVGNNFLRDCKPEQEHEQPIKY